MTANAKRLRFETLRTNLDDRLMGLHFSQPGEVALDILAQKETLSRVCASLKLAFQETVTQIQKCVEETERKLKEKETSLISDQSNAAKAHEDLEKLRSVKAETAQQLQEMKVNMDEMAVMAQQLGSVALETVEQENRFPALHARRNLFYLVSRITWERVSTNRNVVQGFVANALKNDISTFKLDRSDLDISTSCGLLWDYIGAGVSSEWNKL